MKFLKFRTSSATIGAIQPRQSTTYSEAQVNAEKRLDFLGLVAVATVSSGPSPVDSTMASFDMLEVFGF